MLKNEKRTIDIIGMVTVITLTAFLMMLFNFFEPSESPSTVNLSEENPILTTNMKIENTSLVIDSNCSDARCRVAYHCDVVVSSETGESDKNRELRSDTIGKFAAKKVCDTLEKGKSYQITYKESSNNPKPIITDYQ